MMVREILIGNGVIVELIGRSGMGTRRDMYLSTSVKILKRKLLTPRIPAWKICFHHSQQSGRDRQSFEGHEEDISTLN